MPFTSGSSRRTRRTSSRVECSLSLRSGLLLYLNLLWISYGNPRISMSSCVIGQSPLPVIVGRVEMPDRRKDPTLRGCRVGRGETIGRIRPEFFVEHRQIVALGFQLLVPAMAVEAGIRPRLLLHPVALRSDRATSSACSISVFR